MAQVLNFGVFGGQEEGTQHKGKGKGKKNENFIPHFEISVDAFKEMPETSERIKKFLAFLAILALF